MHGRVLANVGVGRKASEPHVVADDDFGRGTTANIADRHEHAAAIGRFERLDLAQSIASCSVRKAPRVLPSAAVFTVIFAANIRRSSKGSSEGQINWRRPAVARQLRRAAFMAGLAERRFKAVNSEWRKASVHYLRLDLKQFCGSGAIHAEISWAKYAARFMIGPSNWRKSSPSVIISTCL
jgi:hypothetical protein